MLDSFESHQKLGTCLQNTFFQYKHYWKHCLIIRIFLLTWYSSTITIFMNIELIICNRHRHLECPIFDCPDPNNLTRHQIFLWKDSLGFRNPLNFTFSTMKFHNLYHDNGPPCISSLSNASHCTHCRMMSLRFDINKSAQFMAALTQVVSQDIKGLPRYEIPQSLSWYWPPHAFLVSATLHIAHIAGWWDHTKFIAAFFNEEILFHIRKPSICRLVLTLRRFEYDYGGQKAICQFCRCAGSISDQARIERRNILHVFRVTVCIR